MKDAKGHGSNGRGGIGAVAKARARAGFRTGNYAAAGGAKAAQPAAHQSGVEAVPHSLGEKLTTLFSNSPVYQRYLDNINATRTLV